MTIAGISRDRPPAPLTRRGLARLALGGGLFGLGGELDASARVERVRWVSVRYRTDPRWIAGWLPPPLSRDVLPDILIEYLLVAGRALSPFGGASVEEFGYFTLQASARYGRRRGMVVLVAITDHEWGRIQAREFLGFPVKPGGVSLFVEGMAVRASCSLDENRMAHRLETVVNDRPAHPLARRAAGFGRFVYRYAPGVDASRSVVDPPVELWRFPEDAATLETGRNPALACDISQTKFSWGAAWPAPDEAPPVREFVGAAYQELTGGDTARWRRRAKQEFMTEVDPRLFAPWVLLRYDRPFGLADGRSEGVRGRVLVAGKLSDGEMSAYRRRKEDALGPMSLVEFRLSIDPEKHAAVLPPGCEPGRRPLLRLLVLRAERGDFSRRPFQEAWLLAYCRVRRHPRWYALSHVAGQGGDLLWGRERFGYPTLKGQIGVGVSADGFHFSGSRHGREFVRGTGSFRGFSTGLSLLRIHVVSLRARPFRLVGPPEGELIEQTWFLQGRRHYADPRALEIEFPESGHSGNVSGAGPKAAPWFELGPWKVVSAGAMEDAHMQRGSGRIAQAVPDFEPFYRERCDGVLPGEAIPSNGVQPTFRSPSGFRPQS